MEDICFDYPLYGNQHYELRLWRRFNYPNSPWTSTYRVIPFLTRATVPDRPPQLLPNEFHHDPEKMMLYVYWKPLEELEFGSTGFQYKISMENSLEALMLGNNSALVHSWDSTQPATVTIWSENNKGRSVGVSQMEVPILTNAKRRQPQDVWYHIDNNTVTWRPPIEDHKLIGYTFFWCLISSNTSGSCNDLDFIEVDGSQNPLQFNKSVGAYRTAVAAKYSENISGGMVWSRPKPVLIIKSYSITYLLMTIIFLMLVAFGLFCLFLNIFRNVRAMANISVELPHYLMIPLNLDSDLKTENLVDLQLSQDPVMGHIRPKNMTIVLEPFVIMENPKGEETNIESTGDLNFSTSYVDMMPLNSPMFKDTLKSHFKSQ